MGKRIVIDPVTRISGFLEIDTIIEDGVIKDVKTSGLLYRGFEKMLKGRSPFDATYFTERICGICSSAHAVASTRAIENALKINVDLNDLYLRDLIHGFEFLQNHLRQFYFFTVPDYVKLPDVAPLYLKETIDFRIPEKYNNRIVRDYLKSIELSSLAHEGLAVLGGKAPHNHGIFIGGVTVNIDSSKLIKIKSILYEIKRFIDRDMITDINIIAEYYPEYFHMGESYNNFLSYGLFDNYDDPKITYVKPGVMINGQRYPFDKDKITENIKYSWYTRNKMTDKFASYIDEETDRSKEDAYTFIKAPRYDGLPMETGPLARLIIAGEYKGGSSCMGRNLARVIETKRIADIMLNILEKIKLKDCNQGVYEIPDKANGFGFIDTVRGSLAHFTNINNKVIENYDIITPSGWNLSPKDEKGVYGVSEKSLLGTKIALSDKPVEIGRIIRSFDPCISCATHIISNHNEPLEIWII